MNRASEVIIPVLVCTALAACSPRDNGKAPTAAPPASAVVAAPLCPPEMPVKVDDITITGSTATVTLNPDPRQIGRNAGGVRWTLKSPQGKTYAFTGDGVVFKPGAPASGPASAPPTGKADEFVWCFDATSADFSWPYKIKFFDTTLPATVWVCDPTVVNFEGLTPMAQVTVSCVPQ